MTGGSSFSMLIPCLLFLLFSVDLTSSSKLTIDIQRSNEPLTLLTSFAFTSHGHVRINVTHLQIFSPEKSTPANTSQIGFFRVLKTNFSVVQGGLAEGQCVLTSAGVDTMFSIADMGPARSDGERPSYNHHEDLDHPGEFLFFFANCAPGSRLVSGTVDVDLYNGYPDGKKNYLPAGQGPIPYICFVAGMGYWILASVWLWQAKSTWFQTMTPQAFHFSISILLMVNISVQFVTGIRCLVIQFSGTARFWEVLIQGELFVQTVLVLFTFFSGLQKVEPYLSDMENGSLLVAIPGLVISYFLTSVMEYNVVGSSWDACVSLLKLFIFILESISWGLVVILLTLSALSWLFSTVWASKRTRRQSRGQEEEFDTPFERFYIVCLIYIVSVAVVLKVLELLLPYWLVWLNHSLSVFSILLLYVYVLYKIRPQTEKSVYQLFDETDTLDEELENL